MESYKLGPPRPASVAAPGDRDLLQLLANPTNRTILSVLSLEPQYPRRLAELVGLTEDEASRRLRSFEKLGLAEASWANVGKNVRLYRLATDQFTVKVDASGLSVQGVRGDASPVAVGSAAEAPPTIERFTGRLQELKEVATQLESRHAVCVHGIGGAGKTALAARLAAQADGSVLWHTLSPSESGRLLLGRLAASQPTIDSGERAQRLLLLRDVEDEDLLIKTLLESLNETRTLLVLDRFEAAGEGAADLVADLSRGLTTGRLLVTARAFPAGVPRDRVAAYRLGGLRAEDAKSLLASLGATPTHDALEEIYDRTHGHPLSLVLISQVSESVREARVERLMQESGIRDFLLNDVIPQLSEAERDLLFALSVFRQPLTAEDVEAVSGAKHALHTLLKLESRGLVNRAGDTYVLHDLLTSFLAEAAPQRRQLHARAAKVLKASGEPTKVLEGLHHLVEAGAIAEAGALVQEEVAKASYRFIDLGLSARYEEVLRRLLTFPAVDGASRGAAEISLCFIEVLKGEADGARAHLEAAEQALRRSIKSLAVPLLLAKAKLQRLEGHSVDASKTLEQAEQAAVRARDAACQLQAIVDRAFLAEETSDLDALQLYRRALELGKKSSDIRQLSVAYSGAARIGMRQGQPGNLELAQEGLKLARMAGYLRGEVSGYMTLTTFALMAGQTVTGLEYSDRYLQVANQLGDPWLTACALSDKAMLLVATRMYEQGLTFARQALELANKIRSPFYQFASRVAIAEALVGLSRGEEALDYLEPIRKIEVSGWPAMGQRGYRLLASLLRTHGRSGEATVAETESRRLGAIQLPGDVTKEWVHVPEAAGVAAQGTAKSPRSSSRRRPKL